MSEVIETPVAQTQLGVMPAQAATPAMLLQIAVQSGADLERLEKLMDLQYRWQAAEARKVYDDAFARFKAVAVKIVKNKEVAAGPLQGKKYAELHAIVNAVTPSLSEHGLSSSWRITQDEKDWIQVTCTLRHISGHEESVSMGAPPDSGGAKNVIQARASTVSYLERYTLKAILGLSEQDDDTDGNPPPEEVSPEVFALLEKAKAEAGKGISAYEAFWKSIKVTERKAIGTRNHETFKAIAEKVK